MLAITAGTANIKVNTIWIDSSSDINLINSTAHTTGTIIPIITNTNNATALIILVISLKLN